MDGFRAFTWDLAHFPDPAALLTSLHAQGFHTVAIVDPGLKQDLAWPVYLDGLAKAVFVTQASGEPYIGQVWPGAAAFPDFTRAATRAWFAQTLVPLETALGIDGLWIDMNEPSDFNAAGTVPDTLLVDGDGHPGTMAGAHNLYALRMAEAAQAGLVAAHPNNRPFVLTRAGYAGIQRHAAAWTGDAPSTLQTLQGTLPMLLGLGLSGEPWVGSDVGGYSGQKDPGLFARWWSLGTISPFFRGHAEKSAPDQEPWQWGTEVLDLARAMLQQRMRLLPYLESLADVAHQTGAPVLRPLFWEFPEHKPTELVPDEAMLGPFLLYAPHSDPAQPTRQVTFPPGQWVQAWSGAVVQGPATVDVTGPLADLPLWLRAGAIVPRGPVRQFADDPVDGPLDVELVPGLMPTTFVLRQDAGDGPPDAPLRRTTLALTPTAGGQTFTATVQPGSTFTPPQTSWRLRFWRLDAAPTVVSLNGQSVNATAELDAGTGPAWHWDGNERTLVVRVDAATLALGTWSVVVAPVAAVTELAPPVQVKLHVTVPVGTPPTDTLYVAHSANAWTQQPLPWIAPGVAEGTVTVPRGQWFEYKYTRGGWPTVEKYPACVEAKNRYAFGAVHAAGDGVAGKVDTVWGWADWCP